MKKQLKPIPEFKTESAEIAFWETHDTTDYYDASKTKQVVFPNLKPSTETISIRLPSTMLSRIKTLANRNDVPYQSFMKIMLSQRLQELVGSKIGTTSIRHLRSKTGKA